MRDVAAAQVERIRSFIMSVPMFTSLDLYEQTKLAEAMREVIQTCTFFPKKFANSWLLLFW